MNRISNLPGAWLGTAFLALTWSTAFSQGQSASTPGQAIAAVTVSQPAQTTGESPAASTQKTQAAPPIAIKPAKTVSRKDRRRAERLFVEATKLFAKEQFDAAMRLYQEAAALDPTNSDYSLAVQVCRSHVVTELIQKAARARMQNDQISARADLRQALALDPSNPQLAEHLQELAGEAVADQVTSIYEAESDSAGQVPVLASKAGVQSFHLKDDRRQLIQKVFAAYGITATIDSSVPAVPARFDLDDVTFAQAARALGMSTKSFWVPLDERRVLVANDTRANREQFERQEMETVYLQGLNAKEMTDVGNLAKNVFQAQQAVVEPSLGKLTIRAPSSILDAFNATLRELQDGRNQVLLDVRLIQLAHTNERNTGVLMPQQITAFNVYAEEQSILNANQALVQQIISSGLASPGDTLAILGILLASGQVSSSLFSNGIALFGGGLTLSGLSPGPTTANLSLNTSSSRELDQIQLRLGDGEEGTLRDGMRYPIMTSSYSGLPTTGLNIPGLTSAGTSSSLSALISSLAGAASSIPQVDYQDLGMTLKATPQVMRSGDVALTLDMKITALAGPLLNGLPVLDNRSYSGVVMLREGAGVVVVSELNKQESRALSGIPGITEVPGLNNLTGNDTLEDYATLVIIISPHVIRGYQSSGRSPMVRVERNSQSR